MIFLIGLNPDTILKAEAKLETITESLKKWEAIQPAISLIKHLILLLRKNRVTTTITI